MNIRLEVAVGAPLREADVVAKRLAFAAKLTRGHDWTPSCHHHAALARIGKIQGPEGLTVAGNCDRTTETAPSLEVSDNDRRVYYWNRLPSITTARGNKARPGFPGVIVFGRYFPI